jgi:predicted metal-dependent peptidase
MSLDLSEIAKELIVVEPFYGYFSLGVSKELTESKDIPTACVTLESINTKMFFNEKYMSNLTDDQKIGVMQHELMHIINFHITQWKDYADLNLFNIAADMHINQYIPEARRAPNIMLPEVFPDLNLPKFQDTRTYYELLKQAQNAEKSKLLQAITNAMQEGKKFSWSHQWEDMPETDRSHIEKQVEYLTKKVFEEALEKNTGNLPGYLRDFVLNIYKKRKPVLDWRAVVRQFKAYCDKIYLKKSRRKLNPKFPYSPGNRIRFNKAILVAIDTSGSVSSEELNDFFNEIIKIADAGSEVHIIECDAKIGRVYRFDKHNIDTKITGGGGTMASPVIEYYHKERKFNGLIYFTDGGIFDSPSIEERKPVLWIVSSRGTTDFGFKGRKVKMQNVESN